MLSRTTPSVLLYDVVFSISLCFFSNFLVTTVEFKQIRYVKEYH